ncbi:MAG: bacillithiol biosynthesis deacetylase BshB1 [Planctomycetota bacterium]|nr:bacillithiol biosynthesis deacetylase BshB1 [Planctomycetota bacterium]
MTTLDVLVIAAHPDDAEISAGGTILRLVDAGARVGVLDVTRGEMGTRGSRDDRDAETARATELLGLTWRGNLNLPDGRVQVTTEAREEVARHLRTLGPDLVLSHHAHDPHPDHEASALLARQGWYLSGLGQLAAQTGGPEARRPAQLAHFMSHVPFEPTFIVDIEPVWERKREAILAYATQLKRAGNDDEGKHLLYGADILERVETKARTYGERIRRRYGEPLLAPEPVALDSPLIRWLGSGR